MSEKKLLVVTPAKDEAKYIGVTIDSVLRQSVRPAEWIIVDDGSVDETPAIAERAARNNAWIKFVRKPVRKERRVGVATVEAVLLARKTTAVPDYEFLAVVDADVVLPEAYFQELLKRFDEEPKLGIAAGRIYDLVGTEGLRKMRGAPEATAGAVKCWRRSCFEEIGGLLNEPGWDGIDQYQASMHGWRTRTYDDEAVKVIHLRQMGSSDRGICYGRIRRGRSGYYMGSHPLWMLASAIFHITDQPFAIASLCTLAGYFLAMSRNEPRAPDPNLLRFVRSVQLSKLRDMLFLQPGRFLRSAEPGSPPRGSLYKAADRPATVNFRLEREHLPEKE